jgi:DNA mismatch repair protein MutS
MAKQVHKDQDTATPLMQQYKQMKAKHPDAIMLFRVGDFYETFGEDAITASQVLGITLTKRNNGGGDSELAGFPYHSLDNYLPKLVRAGYRVAVCDQLEKPVAGRVVKRGITEVVTPGVTLNDSLLNHNTNNYLAAVHFGKNNLFGIALLDVSTGEFLISEGDHTHIDKLLQSFQPSETLFSKTRSKDFEKRFGDKLYHYGIDDWVFMEDYTREKLVSHFQVNSLKGFGVEEYIAAQVAAGAILH